MCTWVGLRGFQCPDNLCLALAVGLALALQHLLQRAHVGRLADRLLVGEVQAVKLRARAPFSSRPGISKCGRRMHGTMQISSSSHQLELQILQPATSSKQARLRCTLPGTQQQQHARRQRMHACISSRLDGLLQGLLHGLLSKL